MITLRDSRRSRSGHAHRIGSMAPSVHASDDRLLFIVPTVSGILTQIGMGNLGQHGLKPAEAHERERTGEPVRSGVFVSVRTPTLMR